MTHLLDQARGRASVWRSWTVRGRSASTRIVTHLRSMVTCRKCLEIINQACARLPVPVQRTADRCR